MLIRKLTTAELIKSKKLLKHTAWKVGTEIGPVFEFGLREWWKQCGEDINKFTKCVEDIKKLSEHVSFTV